MIRYIKILMSASVALFCLFYALQNIWNLDAANWFVAYTTSMEGHEKYPSHFGVRNRESNDVPASDHQPSTIS